MWQLKWRHQVRSRFSGRFTDGCTHESSSAFILACHIVITGVALTPTASAVNARGIQIESLWSL